MPAKIATPPNPLEAYRAAVAATPRNAEAHANLGWGYYGQKQYAEAIQELREAVQLDAKLCDAHYGLGLALKGAGSKAEAVAAFQQAAALAGQIDNRDRQQMLLRLVHGHINQLQQGEWGLEKELYHRGGA